MSVGVCMITRGPAGRVASILDFLRPHVDEIVVAADAAGDRSLEGLRGSPADEVIWFDSPGTLESVLPWALRQCAADWILRIDDDEIPSLDLLDQIRRCDDEATHALVPIRWLWPDRATWWASPPLGTNLHARVCRNIPALWRQDPAVHHNLEVLGPRRVLTAPIYHGVALLLDERTRRAKAAGYEAIKPGVRIEDLPTNALYVPEDFVDIKFERVEPGDAAAVAALLGARPVRARTSSPNPVPASTLKSWTIAPDLDGAHVGGVDVIRPPREMAAGCHHSLEIEVTNRSTVAWPSERIADSPIRVAIAWEGDGELPRILLPGVVPAGSSSRLHAIVPAPRRLGPRRLLVRLVHEHVAWFGETAQVEVDVVEPSGPTPPFSARRAW